jgi:hypothetical protein
MIRHWRPIAVTVGVCAILALAVVFAVRGTDRASTGRALAPGRLVAVSARLVPQSHLFGEPIHVRIDVIVNRSRVDPELVRLHAKWTPYRVVGPAGRVRRDVGSYSQLSWRLQLHCVESQCLPGLGSVRRFRFQSASITYRARHHETTAPLAPISIKWPAIASVSRLDPIDLKRQPVVSEVGNRLSNPGAILPPWRADSLNLDAVSYGLRPGVVFWTAAAAALLLLAAAAGLVRPLIPTPQWLLRRRVPEPTSLERALAAYEEVRTVGDAIEQRLALELLAGELWRSGEGALAWTASELAWSQPLPAAERGGVLTIDVQHAIERRANGSNGN